MNQYVDTIQPELMNITRLFGIADEAWDQPDYTFTAWEGEGMYHCRFTDGTHTAERSVAIPPYEADERLLTLHRKRAARRLVRQTLYDLCREVTGIHPPWGSLTGIRPTHLMYEAIEQGFMGEEAIRYVVDNFDVHPERAALLWEIAQVQGQLPPPEDKWMDVYIGIPFCTRSVMTMRAVSKSTFCRALSTAGNRPGTSRMSSLRVLAPVASRMSKMVLTKTLRCSGVLFDSQAWTV